MGEGVPLVKMESEVGKCMPNLSGPEHATPIFIFSISISIVAS